MSGDLKKRQTYAEAADASDGPNGRPRHASRAAGRVEPVVDDYEAEAQQAHILDYLRVIHRRRWTATAGFVIPMLIALVYVLTATPVYQATARLLIDAERENVVSFKEVVEQSQSTDAYYQTQYQMLQNRALASKTLDSVGLWNHPAFGGTRSVPPSAIRAAISNAIGTFTAATSQLFKPASPTVSPAAGETLLQSRAIDAYLQGLTVAPIRMSRLVDIQFRSSNPALAAKIANAHSRSAIEQNLEFRFHASKEASDWLRVQLAEQRKKVEESELAVQKYREQNDGVSLEDRQSVVAQKLADVSAAVTRARTTRIEKEALYRQLEAIEHNESAVDAFPAVLSNPFIQQLKSQLAELQRQDAQLADQLGERHPDRIKLASAIQLAESKLQAEVTKVVQSVRNDYLSAEAQEKGLMVALEAQQRETLAMNRKGIDGNVLKRDAESNRLLYESLLQRTKETGVSSELRTSNIRLIDPAEIPRIPFSPNKTLTLELTFVVGLMFAAGLALFVEYLDDRIKTPDEIWMHLGLKTLGLIPRVTPELVGTHSLINNGAPPNFAEAFRALRTSVMFSSAGGRAPTILVTSTGPGEGKTMTSCNLAVSIAQTRQRVLLIDADMRRPRVHEVFDVEQEPGLSNLMVGTAQSREAMHPSGVKDLWILPAGHIPPNSAELLTSQQFKDLLWALGGHFDWIVLDSPPVSAVTDAVQLSHDVSGVLFVVGAGKTGRRIAQWALDQLGLAQATMFGAILNGINVDRHPYYYSGYYRKEYTNQYTRTL